ncbi:MAG: DUF4070 domain-containing protein [Gammaproteobacteria bacterium]|nr:DUF4070 domain-containing protein [Gammaproteobacteria bacterium]
MRALLVWPKFAPSFFSLDGVKNLMGKQAIYSPLGLVTIAAILPQEWSFKIVDCSIRPISESDWDWADIVMVSGMITQRKNQGEIIREAKTRGKSVVVGGPFATSVPNEPKEAGADFLVLDEGELTIPLFLDALERGETSGVFMADGEKADMTQSPIPRFDLLNLNEYLELGVQFSRGCPFLCEFCDIPVLFGRKPRTKDPKQVIAELELLIDLGWRSTVMLADDNFIGHKKNALIALEVIREWQIANDYPLRLSTEATINMADDPRLMKLMNESGISVVFIGIETPDMDSLENIKKKQNIRLPLLDRVEKIYGHGFRIISGLILGFDGEQPGAGKRIFEFVDEAAIPIVMVNMLYALPNTPLTNRLESEGRMVLDRPSSSAQLSNFILTRPFEEVIEEYADCLLMLYDPKNFISRLRRHCLKMGPITRGKKRKKTKGLFEIKAAAVLFWRHGIKRTTRWMFWSAFFEILWKNPRAFRRYISCCGIFEHYYSYSLSLRNGLLKEFEQLGENRFDIYYPTKEPEVKAKTNTTVAVNEPILVD